MPEDFPAHGGIRTPDRGAKRPVGVASVTPSIAGTPHVRISRDGGRTYPARHARPLPADPPEPAGHGAGVRRGLRPTGRMLALDLDPARGDVDHQAAELGQLLERLGARYVADVATSTGGRHVYVLFAAPLPWRELRDLARAIALRFPAVDPAPMCSLGGQISPPGLQGEAGRLAGAVYARRRSPWRPSSTRTGRRCGPRC